MSGSAEGVHTVPAPKLLERFRRVLDNKVDDLGQGSVVEVLLVQPFKVPLEGRGELGSKATHR